MSPSKELIISSFVTLVVLLLASPGVFFIAVDVLGPSLGVLSTDRTSSDAMIQLGAMNGRSFIAGIVSPLPTVMAVLVVWFVRKRIPLGLRAVLGIVCGIAALGGVVCWMLVSGVGYSG